MSRAPGGGGYVSKAKVARLAYQMLSQVEMPRSTAFGRNSAAKHDLRTYFITVTAYADAAMHYDITRQAASFGPQTLDPAGQDPPGSAPPSGVE